MTGRVDRTGIQHPSRESSWRWRRLTALVVARDSGMCHVCGHEGAESADHLIRVADGGPRWAPENLKAAHFKPCATCGRRCQQQAKPTPARRANACAICSPNGITGCSELLHVWDEAKRNPKRGNAATISIVRL